MTGHMLAMFVGDAADAVPSDASVITAYGSMVVGILSAITALALTLRKKISEEDIPALKARDERQTLRIKELEDAREADRIAHEGELHQVRVQHRQEQLTLDRHIFSLERQIALKGDEVPSRPGRVGDGKP